MTEHTQMDPEVFSMVLNTIERLEKDKLPLETKLEMDASAEFPMDLVRFMLSPDIALHLIFIPEMYGGLGAGAAEIALVAERMAKMDLGVATSFLAICLGMDPLRVAATEAQKERFIGSIAEKGLIVAYAVTEPEAGSNVQSLKTRAERVMDENGRVIGYRLNGQKQFITNGGVADLYTILANTPKGPSFFMVEAGTEGLVPGIHEDKHGIRASNTCALTLEDAFVPAENLIGGTEGEGLKEANKVFGYTRLMVATFGLGAGMAALERSVRYAKERVQFGTPLIEKQGYTHKLLVPNAVALEAARAYIELVARRIDQGDEELHVEGSIAKYFATEAGDAAANDGIQAFGGYGYMRDYEVEKIKRDVKILPIYEGTSEIQQSIISLFRMRSTVRSKGEFYGDMANGLRELTDDCGGPLLSRGVEVMNRIVLYARKQKLTRSQHVMFLLADMMTWCEVADALCRKAGVYKGRKPSEAFVRAAARLFAREAVQKVYLNGVQVVFGCNQGADDMVDALSTLDLSGGARGTLEDMDLIRAELAG